MKQSASLPKLFPLMMKKTPKSSPYLHCMNLVGILLHVKSVLLDIAEENRLVENSVVNVPFPTSNNGGDLVITISGS